MPTAREEGGLEDDKEKGSKGAETPLICGEREREGVLPVFPYQSHSSESLTCSSCSHHNNLHHVQCVCVCVFVHVRSPTVNSNKQQGGIKYVCQVKSIIDFPSRPHVTTA